MSQTSRKRTAPFGVRSGDRCQPVGTAAAFVGLGKQPPTAIGVEAGTGRAQKGFGDACDERDREEWDFGVRKRRGEGERRVKGFRSCDSRDRNEVARSKTREIQGGRDRWKGRSNGRKAKWQRRGEDRS